MENKVYFFYAKDDEYVGQYIAAKNYKEAKKDALCSGVCDFCDNPFVDIRGYICKDDETEEVIKTAYCGRLSLTQLSELGLLWFNCTECGGDDLEIIDEDSYICKECGHKEKIWFP